MSRFSRMSVTSIVYLVCIITFAFQFMKVRAYCSPKARQQISTIKPTYLHLNKLKLKSFSFDPQILPVFKDAVIYNTVQAVFLFAIKQKSLTTAGLAHSCVLVLYNSAQYNMSRHYAITNYFS